MNPLVLKDPESLYTSLMKCGIEHTNTHFLAAMLDSLANARGSLPAQLGLEDHAFGEMFNFHFPGWNPRSPMTLNVVIDDVRRDEVKELVQLMLNHRVDRGGSEVWIAQIVACACMASDHLWQDLGLWSRNDLSKMIEHNFPALFAMNNKNMKWKKFLYKQLCIEEGIYTCRSPSCEVCADYAVCFSPED